MAQRNGSPLGVAMIGAPRSITTLRLVLRRPKASDAAAVYEYGRDPDVARFMDWPMHAHIDDAIAATDRAVRSWESGDEYSWRITVKPEDTPIGAIGCTLSGHRAEIGFVLARQHWNRGYATEAARQVFEWLGSLPGIHRIQATCDVDNAASARVLEKIGMVRECILRRWAIRPNLPGAPCRDAFLYSWVRDA